MAKRRMRVSLAGSPVRVESEDSILSVVLAQPHRRGNTDQKCASAWGRYILRNKLAQSVYDAGEEYAGTARRWRILQGIVSLTGDKSGYNGGETDPETVRTITRHMTAMESAMVKHSMAALLMMRRMLLDDEDIGSALDAMSKPAAISLANYLGFLPPVAPFHSAKLAA